MKSSSFRGEKVNPLHFPATTPFTPAFRVPRVRPGVIALLLCSLDLAAIALAAGAAFWLRLMLGPLETRPYLLAVPGLLLYPLAYAHAGLYPGYGVGVVELLHRLGRSSSLVSFFLFTATYLFRGGEQVSRLVIVGLWALALVLVPLFRSAGRTLLSRSAWWGAPVLVLGAGRTGELVIHRLSADPALGLRPVACLDDEPAMHGRSHGDVPVIGPLHLAAELARQKRIRTAVLAMPEQGPERLRLVLEGYVADFSTVLIIPDLPRITSSSMSARNLQGVLEIEFRRNLLTPWNQFLKRVLDLTVGIPLLIISAPIICAAALAVKVVSPGAAFYGQLREGLHGRPIRVYKIRTMVPNADGVLKDYLDKHPEARREWEQRMKLRDDPRVVGVVGPFLRRHSLDELPQLWNVIRGDMNLVGPRPFPHYHLERFSEAFRSVRRRVRPGLTGLWQVTARSDADLAMQEELDTYYIRNWSLWLDIYLLARTAWSVLVGHGAY